MTGFIADASVGISWAVPSQGTAATDRLLDEVAAGCSVLIPALWYQEVANSLLILVRRGRIAAAESLRARRALSELRLRVDNQSTQHVFEVIYQLAESSSLTIYDAVYLELAIRSGLPLATRDSRLKQAAKAYVETLL